MPLSQSRGMHGAFPLVLPYYVCNVLIYHKYANCRKFHGNRLLGELNGCLCLLLPWLHLNFSFWSRKKSSLHLQPVVNAILLLWVGRRETGKHLCGDVYGLDNSPQLRRVAGGMFLL